MNSINTIWPKLNSLSFFLEISLQFFVNKIYLPFHNLISHLDLGYSKRQPRHRFHAGYHKKRFKKVVSVLSEPFRRKVRDFWLNVGLNLSVILYSRARTSGRKSSYSVTFSQQSQLRFSFVFFSCVENLLRSPAVDCGLWFVVSCFITKTEMLIGVSCFNTKTEALYGDKLITWFYTRSVKSRPRQGAKSLFV